LIEVEKMFEKEFRNAGQAAARNALPLHMTCEGVPDVDTTISDFLKANKGVPTKDLEALLAGETVTYGGGEVPVVKVFLKR
jgi:hypothetical protein